jgi:hypothetical protein
VGWIAAIIFACAWIWTLLSLRERTVERDDFRSQRDASLDREDVLKKRLGEGNHWQRRIQHRE